MLIKYWLKLLFDKKRVHSNLLVLRAYNEIPSDVEEKEQTRLLFGLGYCVLAVRLNVSVYFYKGRQTFISQTRR